MAGGVSLGRSRSHRALARVRDWLGIGIRTAKPAGWKPQLKCTHSNELGTVAGYFETGIPQVKYALTCAHVLPDKCSEHRITRCRQSPHNQPDAALLREHPCVNQLKDGTRVSFVSNRNLRQLWERKTTVYRAGGYSASVPGYVKHREAGYVAKDGTVEEFPACVVKTKRLRYAWGLLPRPFFRRRYSDQGDSGSWVMVRKIEDGTPSWLGMVVAGGEQDDKMESYVLRAGALMLYFRRQLSAERPLIPYITEDF
jgi:hypothetical protein